MNLDKLNQKITSLYRKYSKEKCNDNMLILAGRKERKYLDTLTFSGDSEIRPRKSIFNVDIIKVDEDSYFEVVLKP